MLETRIQRLNKEIAKKRWRIGIIGITLLFFSIFAASLNASLNNSQIVGIGLTETANIPITETPIEQQELEPEPVDPLLSLFSENEEDTLNYLVFKRYLNKQNLFTEDYKIAYITIDDGPNPGSTEKILEILAAKKIPATFFVLGSMIEKHPNLLQAIVEADEGHALGNHGYSHVYKTIYSSANNFLWEINETKKLILEVTGVETNIIRAPGGTTGHFTEEYFRLMEKNNYIIQDWNVDTKDSSAKKVGANEILNNTILQSDGLQEAVILMHDAGRESLLSALPIMIDYLILQGYEFAVLPNDRAVATHRPKPLGNIGQKVDTVLATVANKQSTLIN